MQKSVNFDHPFETLNEPREQILFPNVLFLSSLLNHTDMSGPSITETVNLTVPME